MLGPTEPGPESVLGQLGAQGSLWDQWEDPTFARLYGQLARTNESVLDPCLTNQDPQFELQGDLLVLMTKDQAMGNWWSQLLVPQPYCKQVLRLAHARPWGGHLGQEKTQRWVLTRFFWPGVFDKVKYGASCLDCQLVVPRLGPKTPLVPVPLIDTPFEWVRVG